MCGITGIFESTGDASGHRELVAAMTDSLVHRGPDEGGDYCAGAVAFGHRRLSIVDVAHGQQPMMNEAGDVVVICNGEIYNSPRLREELIARGHDIKTLCDVEVIPHLYEEYGDDFCRRLEGMFAIALHDRRRNRLLLARDHVGIKPLYYAEYRGRLAFASEMKALLRDPELPRFFDYQALHDYLSFLYPLPPRTFLQHVREVEPGTLLVVDENGPKAVTYWRPSFRVEPMSESKALVSLEEIMHSALRDHLLSDVLIGAFLSGGIDSSLVVGTLSQQLGVRPPTFTVGFAEAQYDESPFARAVAEQCRTEHHVIRVAANGADVELVRNVVEQFDQPFADSSAIPTYLICREIRSHVKVAFSGDGGDELFGGYPEFIRGPWIHRLGKLPAPVLRLLSAFTNSMNGHSDRGRQITKALRLARLSVPELVCALHTYLGEPEKSDLYRPEALERMGGYSSVETYGAVTSQAGPDVFDQVAAARLRINLHADMLRKVDMMSMAHSLEVRVPLLDRRLVEFACRVPRDLKVRRLTNKFLLRQQAAKLLPPQIARKPKWGFGIPLDSWTNPEFMSFVRGMLLSPGAVISQLIKPERIKQIVDWFESGNYDRSHLGRYQVYQRLYQLLCLELWLRRWNPSLN